MFQILDIPTLLKLLDAPQEAVFRTIEAGLWSDGIWPGHPQWDLHETCAQVRSLALHYATVNHPTADVHHYDILAQVLASQACPQGGSGHLDDDLLVHQAMLWLWAFAGGPSPAEMPERRPSSCQDTVSLPGLPGGAAVAFTTAALALLDALVFSGEAAAQQVAFTFLQGHDDALARRALEVIESLSREEMTRAVDDDVSCAVCGAERLELWYSGQTWGETLCETCYEARVVDGQARPQDT